MGAWTWVLKEKTDRDIDLAEKATHKADNQAMTHKIDYYTIYVIIYNIYNIIA